MAEQAKKAEVDITLDIWEGMVHGFQLFTAFAPEGREAIKKISDFTEKFYN